MKTTSLDSSLPLSTKVDCFLTRILLRFRRKNYLAAAFKDYFLRFFIALYNLAKQKSIVNPSK